MTDKASCTLLMDEHVKAVLEFMQSNIPTAKLIGLAEKLPELARLLWSKYPQEPCFPVSLESAELSVKTSCETQ